MRKINWSVQLNAVNVFNQYEAILLPHPTTGYSNTVNMGATIVEAPRNYILSTTFDF